MRPHLVGADLRAAILLHGAAGSASCLGCMAARIGARGGAAAAGGGRRKDDMAGRHTNWRSLTIVISLGILIAVELFGVALAAGWALAGLFELGALFE